MRWTGDVHGEGGGARPDTGRSPYHRRAPAALTDMAHAEHLTWIALAAGTAVPCIRLTWAWPLRPDPRMVALTGALVALACVWIATIHTAPRW